VTYETLIDEPVKVWVLFDHGLFPMAMNWNKKLIKFQKMLFASSKRVGQVKIINFVCASDSANFELEYNSDNYIWRLKKIMPLD